MYDHQQAAALRGPGTDTALISDWLIQTIANTLEAVPDRIDPARPFSDLGLKSKALIQVVAALGRWLGRPLPATLGFDYPNILSLAAHLTKPAAPPRPRIHLEQAPLPPATAAAADSDVAIIGMGCRLPGGCATPEAYWNILLSGKDAITEVPASRFSLETYFDPTPGVDGKVYTRFGGFIDDVDQFDPAFFGITPREARQMDPQQRLLMEVAWEALEDARIAPTRLADTRTGVFVGISGSDYGRQLFSQPDRLDLYAGTGNSTAIAANRISYFLGLSGPSLSVDTACSSSLVSVHLAYQSLGRGECDLALAGGVNLILSPEMTIVFCKARLMSPDGRCKPFDARANGYVRSEGAGMVALKRLSDAMKDKDPILAVIKGSAVNQDGQSNGLTVPSGRAQTRLIQDALENAGVAPEAIDYIETHGTGTAVGDPIEVRAISEALGTDRDRPLYIGSAKSNIGHLEQAAGVAGLIKLVLALSRETIPPNLHFESPNPMIDLDAAKAKVPVAPTPWPRRKTPRLAGISGFSFGGVNAHLILSEAPEPAAAPQPLPETPQLLTLSAQTPERLVAQIETVRTALTDCPASKLADFCQTLNTGRADFAIRAAVVAHRPEAMAQALAAVRPEPRAKKAPKIAFLFTGQGSQSFGMGQDLYLWHPAFRDAIDACAKVLDPLLPAPLTVLLWDGSDADAIHQTAITQPALFAVEYALAKMWEALGVTPDLVMGHSIGEFVAACLAGVMDLESALTLVAARGRLIQSLPQGGAMAAVFGPESAVTAAIIGRDDIGIAAVNSPENCVISGSADAVAAALTALEKSGYTAVPLRVSHAFHSPLMNPILGPFTKEAARISFHSPKIPMISNLTGKRLEAAPDADFWRQHLRGAVRFQDGIRALAAAGADILLEVGPRPVLIDMAKASLPESTPIARLASIRPGVSARNTLLNTLGRLYTAGVGVDKGAIDPGRVPARMTVPKTRFIKDRFWIAPSDTPMVPAARVFAPETGIRHDAPDGTVSFRHRCSPKSPLLAAHRVHGQAIVSGSTLAAMIRAAVVDTLHLTTVTLSGMVVETPLQIPEGTLGEMDVRIDPSTLRAEVFSRIETAPGRFSPWQRHIRTRIETGPASPVVPIPWPSADPATETIDAPALYRQVGALGLVLGREFTWMEQIEKNRTMARALMRRPDPGETITERALPPGLLDGCTQLLFACLPFSMDTAYMFLGYDRITLHKPVTGDLVCTLRLTQADPDGETASADFYLHDADGNRLAEAEGVYLKRAPKTALTRPMAETPDLHRPDWQPVHLKMAGGQAAHWHLTSLDIPPETDALTGWLQDHLASRPEEIRLEIKTEGTDLDALARPLDRIADLVRALSNRLPEPVPPLRILTRGGQAVLPKEAADPAQHLIWGFVRCLAPEFPELTIALIDFDPSDPNGSTEIPHISEEGPAQLALRGKTVYGMSLTPMMRPPLSRPAVTGTQIITGGFGGLGLRLAAALADAGADRIILTGRSGAPESARDALAAIEAKGVALLPLATDITDPDAVADLIQMADDPKAPLTGIFHLAAVLDDGLVATLTPDRLRKVLAPKVIGARLLDAATSGKPLSHFTLFSSMVGLTGSPGQAAYGAANAFLDGLAATRRARGEAALSLNWGPFDAAGMAAGLSGAHKGRWTEAGVTLMDPGAGMTLALSLIKAPDLPPQIAPVTADWTRFAARFLGAGGLLPKTAPGAEAEPPAAPAKTRPDLSGLSEAEQETALVHALSTRAATIMDLPEETLDPDKSLMEIGLDSLMALELRARITADLGVEITLGEVLNRPTLRQMAALIRTRYEAKTPPPAATEALPQVTPDPASRHLPFPLSDVQYAYWIGRSGSLPLGRVSCHVYVEMETIALDPERLGRAIDRLVRRHDMLRAVVQPNGEQRIRPEAEPYTVTFTDLSGADPKTTDAGIMEIREAMTHQILPAETGPLFDIRLTRTGPETSRLHIGFDLLIGDGWSFNILIRDLARFYLDPETEMTPLALSFRDYIRAEHAIRRTDRFAASQVYWRRRIDTLPPAPDLPLKTAPEQVTDQRFTRLSATLGAADWRRLKEKGAAAGLTPSGILLAAFCDILTGWSRAPHYTLNLTMFNRLPVHPEVNAVVGDFTTLNLLEIDHRVPAPFGDRARALQGQLWEDLEHRYVSGVEVLREIAARQGNAARFPVVFTSVLPYSGTGESGSTIELPDAIPATLVHCISQTPQVWLDHQIFEFEGRLTYNWDLVADLFPDTLVEAMFEAYADLLARLIETDTAWERIPIDPIPAAQLKTRAAILPPPMEVPDQRLHEPILDRAETDPDRIAVIAADHTLTFRELIAKSDRVAAAIAARNVAPGQVVAVVMEKGWAQVAGVIGALTAGTIYLPIDPHLPEKRLAAILTDAKAALVLTDGPGPDLTQNLPIIDITALSGMPKRPIRPRAEADDLAYLIYTSGSTGTPKGVMISHKAAMTTITEVNTHLGVTADDRILGVSNLFFDLSVYDIFGPLAAGAALVLPPPEGAKDPGVWAGLIDSESVSIWNSVPALMGMLVEYAAARNRRRFDSIRAVMLSGDWIPIDLPKKIVAMAPNAKVDSLGGATEAAIWSVRHEIDPDAPPSRAIPYGRPLANQGCQVLSDRLTPCPDGVIGDLYISGDGLAKGYWNDPEKTAAAFIRHPETGTRLYRTGDLARYLSTGDLDLIGRADHQIKLQGHRIELGEIESVLTGHPEVRDGAVALYHPAGEDPSLVAYLVFEDEAPVPATTTPATPKQAVPYPNGTKIIDPLERLKFKSLRPGIRTDLTQPPILLAPDTGALTTRFTARRSERVFHPAPLTTDRFFGWLSHLAGLNLPGAQFSKYGYGSAGGLYPVQAYLHVKSGRVTGLSGGDYYLLPDGPALLPVGDAPPLNPAVFSGNDPIWESAAFALFLVADTDAMAPLYGEKTWDFCLIEAGLITQMLETAAPEFGLGICQIGVFDFAAVGDRFRLTPHHQPVHALIGGGSALAPADPQTRIHNIRRHLEDHLPGYMVPSKWVPLDRLPLSTNGKVDRKALPAPPREVLPEPKTPATPVAAPPVGTSVSGDTATALIDILKAVLGTDAIDPNRNFFDLGASSLHLVRIQTRIHETLGLEVPIVRFFEHPSVAALARAIDAPAPQPSSAPRRTRRRRERR